MNVLVKGLNMPAQVLQCHEGRRKKLQIPCQLKCQWKARCTRDSCRSSRRLERGDGEKNLTLKVSAAHQPGQWVF